MTQKGNKIALSNVGLAIKWATNGLDSTRGAILIVDNEADPATFSTAIKTAKPRPATQPSNKAYAIAMIFGVALGMTIATVAWAEMTEINASQVERKW